MSRQTHDSLASIYRTTFKEYASSLRTLQRLMDASLANPAEPDRAKIDAVLLSVEKARAAHSCARDRLARALLRSASRVAAAPPVGVNEVRIRNMAKLLWELAGRPEGTAEQDWRKAEQLVQAAGAGAC